MLESVGGGWFISLLLSQLISRLLGQPSRVRGGAGAGDTGDGAAAEPTSPQRSFCISRASLRGAFASNSQHLLLFFFFFSKAWPWAAGAGFACMLREAGWKSLGFTALLQSSQVVRG